MLCLLLLASAAPSVAPAEGEARRVIEWQLRAPPRPDSVTGLSAEEAAIIRNAYLQSIGQRPPRPAREPLSGDR